MIPYQKLFKRKPEVSYLQRFGCKAFKSLQASHRSKFGTRAHPLFMLDYVCYTLNIMGRTFGYGQGRKVSETRYTVLGRHTETGQPTA